MSDKIYCPKFVAAVMPRMVSMMGTLSQSDKASIDDAMLCDKEICGYFSKKHGVCALVAIADKAPLTVALDIPADIPGEEKDVEGWGNK